MDSEKIELILGTIALAVCLIMEHVMHIGEMPMIVVSIIGYIIVAHSVVIEAIKNIIKGDLFDEETLMTVATIGAFFVGGYSEAIAVMLFFRIGEEIEGLAIGKSRSSVRSLMDLQPDTANLVDGDDVITVESDELDIDDIVLVRAGERVPADGIVIDGTSSMDTMSLTGESMPRDVSPGDNVLSGFINMSGALRIKVERKSQESTASRIMELIEDAERNKSRSERFITSFSRIYTPIILVIALMVAVIPPLLFGGELSTWAYRALTILVISCPCALVISVPLSFFCGIGKASSEGILVKGSDSIETMSKTRTVVMDKTGTLTKGIFAIADVHPEGISKDELVELVAAIESFSDHPMSRPFKEMDVGDHLITTVNEISGMGIKARVDDDVVCVGNVKMMHAEGIDIMDRDVPGILLHASCNGVYLGYIVLEDQLKESSKEAVSDLKHDGIRTVMLTGDRLHVGKIIAERLGIDEVHADMLPADKLDKMEDYLDPTGKDKLMFVGDGMNDAPSLARSDVGVAMGGIGSDAAIEAADVVIMSDDPSKIPYAIDLSKKVMTTVWVNVIAALFVKFGFVFLAMSGLVTMWAGVFADVGIMILCVLNSIRILGRGALKNVIKADVEKEHACCCDHC